MTTIEAAAKAAWDDNHGTLKYDDFTPQTKALIIKERKEFLRHLSANPSDAMAEAMVSAWMSGSGSGRGESVGESARRAISAALLAAVKE